MIGYAESKEKDLELWKKWRKTPTQDNASLLVNQLLPLVKRDVYKYSANIPYSIVEGQAKILILEACKNYNPSTGVALSTFVSSYMIKLSQHNEAWRSPIKIPANRAGKYHVFKNTIEELQHSLGREPTVHEIADELKWSKAEVQRFLKEIRQEFSDDRPFISNYHQSQSQEEEMIDFIYHDLTDKEKILFERTTGYGGKVKLNNDQLCKLLNINQNQLSYEKKKLTDKISNILSK